MSELLTAAQMRAVEQAAIETGKASGLALMERAGRGVVEAVFAQWPELTQAPHRAVVLCGPGNNGGDGFVIARRLSDKGWEVEVFFFGKSEKLPPDARRNYDIWREMGAVRPLSEAAVAQGERPVLLIDALFGTGLSRAIPLELAKAHHGVERRAAGARLGPYYRVSVDCISGMDADSGRFLLPSLPDGLAGGESGADAEARDRWWTDDAAQRLLRCDLTVTFHRKKICHVLSEQPGKVVVVDIGLGEEDRHPAHLRLPRPVDRVFALDFDGAAGRSGRVWPGPLLSKASGVGRHKYEHGHALILSGGAGRSGAARLAARGALRIGAGLVTLGVSGSAQMEVAAQVTALMLRRAGTPDEVIAVLEDGRINAVCLGPGLGLERARGLVEAVLSSAAREACPTRATVLDADALTGFAAEPEALFALLDETCVLTPHGGEFARLFPDIDERLEAPAISGPAYSPVDATREAARRAGCVVLLKGENTVIAHPDGRCSIHSAQGERAAPWLATAGAGDVLAGFIAGLLARGLGPMEAAETAAWLHVECARSFGPGLIAEDLPEELPKVLRALGV